MQPVRDRQQDGLDARIVRQLLIQAINRQTIGIGQRLRDHAAVPDHVVENKKTVRFHLRQENFEIGVIAWLVGIDKGEVERRARFPIRQNLLRIAQLEFNPARDSFFFQ